MAQSLVSRIGASPVWRAGLASAFILGLAGFAAVVIPTACRNGFVVCQASTAPVEAPLAEQLVPEATAAEAPVEQVVAEITPAPAAALEPQPDNVTAAKSMADAMVKQQPASLTRNDLIAQTFGALDLGLTTTATELTARKVRTVNIGPDGMPIVEPLVPAATASEEPAPIVVAEAEAAPEPEPAPVAATPPPAEEPVAEEEDEPTASAYAPVGRGTAVVGRQGANIRSLPKTRGSQVLFSLAAGEEVTVMETEKGWHKVVDSRGRSGWVWSELVRR